jgi:hypothetical protein
MGVLAALFGGSYAALSGPSKKTVQTPPINASSPEEGDFIKCDTSLFRPPRAEHARLFRITRRLTLL